MDLFLSFFPSRTTNLRRKATVPTSTSNQQHNNVSTNKKDKSWTYPNKTKQNNKKNLYFTVIPCEKHVLPIRSVYKYININKYKYTFMTIYCKCPVAWWVRFSLSTAGRHLVPFPWFPPNETRLTRPLCLFVPVYMCFYSCNWCFPIFQCHIGGKQNNLKHIYIYIYIQVYIWIYIYIM